MLRGRAADDLWAASSQWGTSIIFLTSRDHQSIGGHNYCLVDILPCSIVVVGLGSPLASSSWRCLRKRLEEARRDGWGW